MDFIKNFALAALVALALTLGACGKAPKLTALPAGTVVLAIGDSVTHGTGAGTGEDYPTQLARITGWSIYNHGIPGDTSAGLRARIDQSLEETKPALVILEIGGNDFLKRQPEAETRGNVRAILQRIKQANIPVVLVSTPKFSPLGAAVGMLPDAPIYAELAKEESVVLIPEIFAKVLGDPDLKADPIHPNAAGYRKMAEGIAAGLAQSGLLKR